jgi:hypothetical protein
MGGMFQSAAAFKQTIPEEWKNKGDLWGQTSEKQRTADNCGCFVPIFPRGLVNQQGQIQLVTRKEKPNGRFFLVFFW